MTQAVPARPAVTGTPVVSVPADGSSDYVFTWNGTIAATVAQAIKGAQDLISQQVSSGAINSDSSVTVNPDNTFTLHISKDVLFQTVTVDCQGSVSSATDASGNTVTAFILSNGTVNAGGLASQDQVTSQLETWVGQWERQAQAEPKAPSVSLPGE